MQLVSCAQSLAFRPHPDMHPCSGSIPSNSNAHPNLDPLRDPNPKPNLNLNPNPNPYLNADPNPYLNADPSPTSVLRSQEPKPPPPPPEPIPIPPGRLNALRHLPRLRPLPTFSAQMPRGTHTWDV